MKLAVSIIGAVMMLWGLLLVFAFIHNRHINRLIRGTGLLVSALGFFLAPSIDASVLMVAGLLVISLGPAAVDWYLKNEVKKTVEGG